MRSPTGRADNECATALVVLALTPPIVRFRALPRYRQLAGASFRDDDARTR